MTARPNGYSTYRRHILARFDGTNPVQRHALHALLRVGHDGFKTGAAGAGPGSVDRITTRRRAETASDQLRETLGEELSTRSHRNVVMLVTVPGVWLP